MHSFWAYISLCCVHFVHPECLLYLIKDLKVLGNIEVADPRKELWTEEMQMANYRMNRMHSKSEIKLFQR